MNTNLDVLRAIAVLLVLGAHTWGAVFHVNAERVGRFGVFLFFVHTCRVLMSSLARQQAQHQDGLFWRFYVRRAFRIYPLAIVVVLAVAFLPRLFAGTPIPPADQIASNALLVTNLTGYFNLFPTLWTLPLEVQMYVLLPAIYLLLPRLKPKGLILLWIGSVLVASLLVEQGHGLAARLRLLNYVPFFLPGIIAYQRRHDLARVPGWLWPVSLLVLTAASCWIDLRAVYWIVILFVGLTVSFYRPMTGRFTRAAHYVATYSYGIYLWHFPAFWVVAWLGQGPVLTTIVWLALVAGLPMLSYHLLEHPLTQLGLRLSGSTMSPEPSPAPATNGG